MAKITRFPGNVKAFASSASATLRTIFGGVTESDTLADNLNADYEAGWEIVAPSGAPTKQDFNALGFAVSQQVAYLMQVGVPEWHASQEYHLDSLANRNGVLYHSKVNDNTGNIPESSPTQWAPVIGVASETQFTNSGTTLTGADLQTTTEELDTRSRINWWRGVDAGSMSGISSGGAPALCALSNTEFAFFEASGDVLGRYVYDHALETITQVGVDSAALTGASYCGVTALSATRVAVIAEGYGLATFEWDVGTTRFVQLGNILTISGMMNPAVVALSATRVAVWHTEAANTRLKTFDFDGTDWAPVGNTYSHGSSTVYTAITAFDSDTVVINAGSQGRNLRTMAFDGTDWAQVGASGPNIGTNCGEADMCALTATDILHVDSWNEEAAVWRFKTDAWEKVTVMRSEAIPSGHVPSLCALLDDLVVYKESHESSLRALKLEKLNSTQPFRPF